MPHEGVWVKKAVFSTNEDEGGMAVVNSVILMDAQVLHLLFRTIAGLGRHSFIFPLCVRGTLSFHEERKSSRNRLRIDSSSLGQWLQRKRCRAVILNLCFSP